MFASFIASRRRARAIAQFYQGIVAQARRPEFYAVAGIPDTMDGRFDMVLLHTFLILHRLKEEGEEASAFGQALFEYMFADMDRSLREAGVGDLSVGKRVKEMGRAFYGRTAAYDTALAADDSEALRVAVDRNLYGTLEQPDPGHVAMMADYIRTQANALAAQPVDRIISGHVEFLPLQAAITKEHAHDYA